MLFTRFLRLSRLFFSFKLLRYHGNALSLFLIHIRFNFELNWFWATNKLYKKRTQIRKLQTFLEAFDEIVCVFLRAPDVKSLLYVVQHTIHVLRICGSMKISSTNLLLCSSKALSHFFIILPPTTYIYFKIY